MDFGKGSVVEWGLQSQGIDTKKYKQAVGEKIGENPIKSGAAVGGGILGSLGAVGVMQKNEAKSMRKVYDQRAGKLEQKMDKLLNADDSKSLKNVEKNIFKSQKLMKKRMGLGNDLGKLKASPTYLMSQGKAGLKGAAIFGAIGAGTGAIHGNTISRTVDEFKHANTESFGLIKIAEEEKDRKTGKRVIEGAGGAALAAGSIGAATGTEKFYHGTSFENAKDIKQNGLLANKGGTGAAKDLGVPQYVDNSQGYVHATKFKPNAMMYAKMNHPDSQKDLEKVRGLRNKIQQVDQSQFRNAVDEFVTENKAMQSRLRARKLSESGEVLKGRVPYNLFNRAEIDTDSGSSKIMAFKTKENIPVEAIHGSSATLGERAKYYGKNFANYAKNHTGRLALGLGGVGLGTAMVGDSLVRDKEKPIAGTLKLASTNYDERMIQNKMRRTGCSRAEAERTMDIADSEYLSEVFMDDFVNKLTGGKK